jgi:hypothetical protein
LLWWRDDSVVVMTWWLTDKGRCDP